MASTSTDVDMTGSEAKPLLSNPEDVVQNNMEMNANNQNSNPNRAQSEDFLSRSLLMMKIHTCLAYLRCYSIVGLLILPMTMSYAGLAFGSIGILVLAIVCIHCNQLIIQSNGRLFERSDKLWKGEITPEERIPEDTFNFILIVEKAFEEGPQSLRRYSTCAKYVTVFFVQLARMLVCIVAYRFMAAGVKELILVLNDNSTDIGDFGYQAWILPVVLFFNAIQQTGFQAVPSSTTDYVVFVAIVITCFGIVQGPFSNKLIPFLTPDPLNQLPVYFGCVMYIFEVTSLILPIRSTMSKPTNLAQPTTLSSIYVTDLSCVYFMYTLVGFFGYLTYGEDIERNVVFNLSKGSWLGQIARSGFIFGIFNEYTTQMTMMVQEFQLGDKLYEQILQIALVLISFGVSTQLSNIDQLVWFVGAFCVTPLIIIFPPVLEMLTMWNVTNGNTATKWKRYVVYGKDVLLISFGVTGLSFGIYAALR